MKKLISLVLITAFPSLTLALECNTSTSEVVEEMALGTDVPKYLEGAVITVTLKDGKTSQVPAEKFKVVPRIQQFIVTKMAISKTCVPEKNRLSLGAGRGPKAGLKSDKSAEPSVVSVESKAGAVGAAQYQRMVSDRISIGVQGQTNKTGLIMLGIDF